MFDLMGLFRFGTLAIWGYDFIEKGDLLGEVLEI